MKTSYKQRLIINGNVFFDQVEAMKRSLSVGDIIELRSQPIKGIRPFYDRYSVKKLYPHYAVMEGKSGIQYMSYNVLTLHCRRQRKKVAP